MITDLRKKRSDDGEQENIQIKECPVSEYTAVSRVFDIYLDEPIEEPTYYRKALKVFEEAGPGDLIKLKIDTPGGRLDTTIKFINAIQNCQADVVGILEGSAASAGSFILLSCPLIQIQPFTSMMCHNASFGSIGSALNVKDEVDFSIREIERIVKKVYKDFLTEKEIENIILANRELRFNDEEIGERLEKMFEKRNQEREEDNDEFIIDAVEEILNKPKKKKAAKKIKEIVND